MDDFLGVAVVDGGEQLLHVLDCIFFTEHGPFDDLLKELAALAELSHNVVAFLILEELMEFQNIRVVLRVNKTYELLENFDFVDQLLAVFLIERRLVNHLQSSLCCCFAMLALIHLSKGA